MSSSSAPATPLNSTYCGAYPLSTGLIHEVLTGYEPRDDGEIRLRSEDLILSVRDLGHDWSLGRNNLSDDDDQGFLPTRSMRPVAIARTYFADAGSRGGDGRRLLLLQEKRTESDTAFGGDGRKVMRQENRGEWEAGCSVDGRNFRTQESNRSPFETEYRRCMQMTQVDHAQQQQLRHPSPPPREEMSWHGAFQSRSIGGLAETTTTCINHPSQITSSFSDGLSGTKSSDHCRIDVGRWKKPRMIVKPNLDHSVVSSAAGVSMVRGQDVSEISHGSAAELMSSRDYTSDRRLNNLRTTRVGSRSRTAVPPTELRLHANVEDRSYCAMWRTEETGGKDTKKVADRCSSGRVGPSQQVLLSIEIDKEADGRRGESGGKRLNRSDDDNPSDRPKDFEESRRFCKDSSLHFAAEESVYQHLHSTLGLRPPEPEVVDRNKRRHRRSVIDSRAFRLIVSILVGQLTGCVVFLWMNYLLDYGFLSASILGAGLALTLTLCLAFSRTCRCLIALLLPSVCTRNGRLAYLIVISGLLVSRTGPLGNVFLNVEEVSRSMSCSAEQSLNQVMLFLRPFDSMMLHLNGTIGRLQEAALNVTRSLRPFHEGLSQVEMDVHNGRMQLHGTRKVSLTFSDTSKYSCTESER